MPIVTHHKPKPVPGVAPQPPPLVRHQQCIRCRELKPARHFWPAGHPFGRPEFLCRGCREADA